MTFAQRAPSDQVPVDPAAGQALLQARQALERHRLDEADSAIRLALSLAPDHWESHHLHGILLARGQRWNEAEASFLRAHQLNPAHPGPLTNLGNLCTERAQYEQAIAYYHKALELDPNYPNAHHNLAVAYRRLGRIDESIRHLKKAQRLEVFSRPSSRSPHVAGGSSRGSYLWWIVLAGLTVLALGIWLS